MIMKIPISFDYSVQINYHDGSVEMSSIFPTSKGLISCIFQKISGYDANNSRVTNLVGYDGIELLKRCPYCIGDKHVTEFGYSGRVTNGKRDQSRCTKCRNI